jgi:hypothetical protein
MPKTIMNPLALVTLLSAALLSGCGGGGGSSTATGSNTGSSTPITTTLDLKSIDGAKNMSSTVFDLIDIRNSVSNQSLAYSVTEPSSSRTIPCTPSGSFLYTVSNPDGITSVNDSYSAVASACATKTATGSYTDSGSTTVTISAINGNLASVPGTSSIALTTAARVSSATDDTLNGVRYAGNVTYSIDTVNTYGHDGKGTAATTDDVDTVATETSFSGSGLTNSLAVSFSSKVSTVCSKTGLASTICSKTEGTFSGNQFSLGTFNVSVKSSVPFQYNANREPIAGALLITQGSDVATIAFAVVNTVSQVTVTSASGAVQVVKFADFIKITETLF